MGRVDSSVRSLVVTAHGRRGIEPPGSSDLFGEAGGGVAVVAEHAGDHRSRGLEDEVADGCGASPLSRKSQVPETEFESDRSHGLSSPAAGEEPAGVRIGRGHGVRSLLQVVQQHPDDGGRDRRRRVAEPDEDLTVRPQQRHPSARCSRAAPGAVPSLPAKSVTLRKSHPPRESRVRCKGEIGTAGQPSGRVKRKDAYPACRLPSRQTHAAFRCPLGQRDAGCVQFSSDAIRAGSPRRRTRAGNCKRAQSPAPARALPCPP